MRDELSRARKRGDRVVMPEQVASPMDLNPTLEVSAALIRDCAYDVGHRIASIPLSESPDSDSPDRGFEIDRSVANDRRIAVDLQDAAGGLDSTVDEKMREAVNGRPPAEPRRETA